jgi:anthranilate synthase component II
MNHYPQFPGLKAVVIDNYDSFTYNLVQYLQELAIDVDVIRNDAKSAEALTAVPPDFFVLSPGPSTPDHAGVCLTLIRACAAKKIPLLGVCLGHQSIGQGFGGKVVRGQEPVHGKTASIAHHQKGVFRGIPSPFTATRYHSLIVERSSLPDCLEVTAELTGGIIMGVRHKTLPIEGVQFHPESVLTEHGHLMLANFASTAKGDAT